MIVQVLLLNNMNLGGYINPYIYILFILLLPAGINKSLLLLLGFLTGLTMDIFGNTLGLHSFACVAIAYIRPETIKLFFRNHEFGSGEEPTPLNIGYRGFVRYSFTLVFTHQLILFYLEAFSLNNFLFTFGKVIFSTLTSLAIIYIAVMIFGKRRKRI